MFTDLPLAIATRIKLADGIDGLDDVDPSEGVDSFFGTELGGALAGLLGIAGLFILLFAVGKAIKDGLGGNAGKAGKTILIGGLLSALFFAPWILPNIGDAFGGLIELVIDAWEAVTGTGD